MSDLVRLLLGVVCVWRVTHLLQAEDGPWNLVVRLRRAAGNGFAGKLLDCFYCLSLWVSVPLAWAIGQTTKERALMWLAFSGGAILLERSTEKATAEVSPMLQALYEEDKGEEGGQDMTCCGAGRRQEATSGTLEGRRSGTVPRSSTLLYEYTGKTGMTVVGPMSGTTYRFEKVGAKARIDRRDAASMAGLPNLRRLP